MNVQPDKDEETEGHKKSDEFKSESEINRSLWHQNNNKKASLIQDKDPSFTAVTKCDLRSLPVASDCFLRVFLHQ